MKINDIEETELRLNLTDNIQDALRFNSQNTGADEIKELAEQFVVALKSKFHQMEIEDVKRAILNGTYGDYGTYKWVNAKVLIEWTRLKWASVLEKRLLVGDEDIVDKVDLNKYPLGQAIIWKMDHVKTKDWEKIPMKKVAEIIKEKGNLRTLASDYGIELIK